MQQIFGQFTQSECIGAGIKGGVNGNHNVGLAYEHRLGVELRERLVEAAFVRARSVCVSGKAGACILIGSNIEERSSFRDGASAMIEVRLPYDEVDPFIGQVTAPLPGEVANAIRIVECSTTAEDLSGRVADGARRLAQLTDYRERLTAIARRQDAKADDLIKLAGTLSEAQSQIEALTGKQQALTERIDTEFLSMKFTAPFTRGFVADVSRSLGELRETLCRQTAEALEVAIGGAPWVGLLLILRILFACYRTTVRRLKRRLAVA